MLNKTDMYNEQIALCGNMVEVENVLSQIRQDYLTRYAKEIEPCPKHGNGQGDWVQRANMHFESEYMRDKQAAIEAIPERLKTSRMYVKLIARFAADKLQPNT